MKRIADAFVEQAWLKTLEKLRFGALRFVSPEGKRYQFTGPDTGPDADFALHDWSVLRRAQARGDIAFGEDYIAGAWDSDDLDAVVRLFQLNRPVLNAYAKGGAFWRTALAVHNKFVRRNSLAGSRRNIEAHYDVGNDFYGLWLDKSMTYSSALWGTAADLEQAQTNKYARILDRIAGFGNILEIGCGWGGFAEKALAAGHRLTGLTVSPAQHRYASTRLGDGADIRLQDYRRCEGTFDAVVSIEMFEAVGEQYWLQYFRALKNRLRRGGRALIQTIAIRDDLFDDYRRHSDFIRQYVFPGGMLPSFARFRQEAERAGLTVVDLFAFGKDYARTLKAWSARMSAAKAAIRALGHDERFFRNWQYYLNICAATFGVGNTDVAQIELVNT